MTWMLQTDQNRQNGNTGNGGDLVKHTVYLTLLDELLKHEPWRSNLRLRECHAGRGIYRPVPETARMAQTLMEQGSETMLARAQAEALDSLGIHDSEQRREYYVGSAVLNLLSLERSRDPRAEYYEYEPDTRNVLEGVLRSANSTNDLAAVSVPGEHGENFDGERHIANSISRWDHRDVVLLDPFSMWRQSPDQTARDFYRDILIESVEKGCPLALFFTWGQAHLVATEDLDRQNLRTRNGYGQILAELENKNANVVIVRWLWKTHFAMWLILPSEEVRDRVVTRLREELGALDDFSRSSSIRRKNPVTTIEVL
jgi:hypothetical protein